MVELSMMVDSQGAVYSPTVARSSDHGFERAALKAALRFKFEPATLDGKAVDSLYTLHIIFRIYGEHDGAGLVFRNAYKSFKEEFKKEQPNRRNTEKRLKKMKNAWNMNEYSIAYLAVAESMYAEEFGTLHEQLEAFKKLRMYDGRAGGKDSLLGDELMAQVKAKIVRLELLLGNLQDAIYSYIELTRISAEFAKHFKKSVVKAHEVLNTETAFARAIDLSDRGSQELTLNATKLSIFEVSGEISTLIFRCQRGYSSLPFAPDSEYSVPNKWGECWLQIEGKAETTAVLHRYK